MAVGTTDTEKMTLFLQCMPVDIVREVRLLQMANQGVDVLYMEYSAKLQDQFGVEYSADARRKLKEVVLSPLRESVGERLH